MYAEFLRQAAWDIEEAEDGREALAKALSRHPDVVITETRLPGISGYDLCRLLREDAATRDIAIVVVTADAFVQDTNRARAAGADTVLVKPCLPDQLASVMRELFEHGAELCARSEELRARAGQQRDRAAELLDKSQATTQRRRVMLSRAHDRRDTTLPPIAPPELVCPSCDQPLRYIKSHVGGVSARHQEQWDYFECPGGCGMFQYRQRTRKVRRVV